MIKLLFTTIFFLLAQTLYPQNNAPKSYKLSVKLNKAPFRTLALLAYKDSDNRIIRGRLTGPFRWEFTLTDSLAANSEYMMLIVPEKDTVDNAYHSIRFHREMKNRKTSITNIGVQNETNYIEAEYTGKTLYEKENVSQFFENTDSRIEGNLIVNEFSLNIKDHNSDITVRSLEPYFGWFLDNEDVKSSYHDKLQSYIKLAREYPDSKYLISYLSLNLTAFKTKQDIKSVYEHFSSELKETKWGKKIENFLFDDFKNITLLNLKSGNEEPLVQDSSTYNLVVFSASWCGPCIEEMPLLKELHKKHEGRIKFTYVSMDNEKGIKPFEKLLLEKDITWRTLYAFKNLEKLTYLYSIKSIPFSFLYYPDGRMEVMDVRDIASQKKLSSLAL